MLLALVDDGVSRCALAFLQRPYAWYSCGACLTNAKHTSESMSPLDGFCLLCAESAERLDDGFLRFEQQRCDRRKSGSELVTHVRPEAHHRASQRRSNAVSLLALNQSSSFSCRSASSTPSGCQP